MRGNPYLSHIKEFASQLTIYFSNGKKLLIITISFIFKKFIQTLHAQSFFPFVIFFE